MVPESLPAHSPPLHHRLALHTLPRSHQSHPCPRSPCLAGTLFLIWNTRWAVVLRAAFWCSSYFRWSLYRAWSTISGQPPPPIQRSPQCQSDAQLASLSASSHPVSPASSASVQPLPTTSVRFLFAIYENQRWWMGLDRTAALLPGERPSWCSASQQPAAPPSSFALPASTTVYTPAPDRKHCVKLTTCWRWRSTSGGLW